MDPLTAALQKQKKERSEVHAALQLEKLGYIARMMKLCDLVKGWLAEQAQEGLVTLADSNEIVENDKAFGSYMAPGLTVVLNASMRMRLMPMGCGVPSTGKGKAWLIFDGFRQGGNGHLEIMALSDEEWVFPGMATRAGKSPSVPLTKDRLHQVLAEKIQEG